MLIADNGSFTIVMLILAEQLSTIMLAPMLELSRILIFWQSSSVYFCHIVVLYLNVLQNAFCLIVICRFIEHIDQPFTIKNICFIKRATSGSLKTGAINFSGL